MAENVPFPGQPVRGSKTGRPVMALFDLLGRAWAMGIIWQLHNGPYTFRQLQDACDGVSPTLLNRRLRELRATGLAVHDDGYRLTDLGEGLYSMIEPLGDWAKQWASDITTTDWTEE